MFILEHISARLRPGFSASCPVLLAGGMLAATSAAGQHLEAVGGAISANSNQTWARQTGMQVEQYRLLTDIDGSRLDDTGSRYSAFARVGFGLKRFFVQPEVAYCSVLGQQYGLEAAGSAIYPWPLVQPFTPRLRRLDGAALAGLRLGKKGYLLAGPVLAFNLREQFNRPELPYNELVESIYRGTQRVQLLAQAGIGVRLWRFDLSARYEHGLTPYTRAFFYGGQTYDYHQSTSQAMLNLGLLLYDYRRPWRAK